MKQRAKGWKGIVTKEGDEGWANPCSSFFEVELGRGQRYPNIQTTTNRQHSSTSVDLFKFVKPPSVPGDLQFDKVVSYSLSHLVHFCHPMMGSHARLVLCHRNTLSKTAVYNPTFLHYSALIILSFKFTASILRI